MRLAVIAVALSLSWSGTAFAQGQSDDDLEEPPSTSQPPGPPTKAPRPAGPKTAAPQRPAPTAAPQPAGPSPLAEARKVLRASCVDEVRSQRPRPRGDDARNALIVCITKAAYDCALNAQRQSVQKADRLGFIDACYRSAGKR